MNPSAIICEDRANTAFVEWRVLIEGRLGKLQRASFVEPEILEVKGNCGMLRPNLRKSEIAFKNSVKKCEGGEIE